MYYIFAIKFFNSKNLNIKRTIITLLTIFSLTFTVTSLQSCKSDCEKYCDEGYCISGDCECKSGWTERFCDTKTGGGSSSSGSSLSSGGSSSSSGGSSSSGSSSSGGGTSDGKVTFYQTSDDGCGTVYVTVGNTSQTITSFYLTHLPLSKSKTNFFL